MRVIVGLSLVLCGCATSVGGIRQEPVVASYQSAKAPREVAQCLQSKMPGLQLDLGDDYYSVSNRNQFGSILNNWLIMERAEGGSLIEFRKTNSIAPGMNEATECF
jgi:hypothetical protein